jgi:transcriptional regulator with XRE-family HTH domain
MKLKDFMKENFFTERRFASVLGISQQHLNFIIRGKSSPSIQLIQRIIKATNGKVTLDDLSNPEAPSRLKKRRGKE